MKSKYNFTKRIEILDKMKRKSYYNHELHDMKRNEVIKLREWLKKSRKDKGITMSDISEKLGISESYYCLIENGERQKRMDISLLIKLADILEIPITEIVNLEERYLSE